MKKVACIKSNCSSLWFKAVYSLHVFDYENGGLAKKGSLVLIIGREETCQIIRALRVLKAHLLWNWPSIQGKFEIDCEVGCKF